MSGRPPAVNDGAGAGARPARWRLARTLLALLVLPNAALLALGVFVFLERPLINVDYLLLGMAQPLVGVGATASLFGLVFLFDAAQALAPGYHFGVRGLLEAAGDLFSLELVHTLGQAALLAGAVALAALLVRRVLPRGGPGRRGVAVLAALVVLVTAADSMLSWNRVFPNERPLLSVNIATSTAYLTASSALQMLEAEEPVDWDARPATSAVWDRIERGGPLPPRIVVAIVESLGSFRDSTLESLQLATLRRPALEARYRVRSGTVRFAGSTVPAELRELCRLATRTVRPGPALLGGARCLPARLLRDGYRTLAVHGFRGTVFDRASWYPDIGFEQAVFARELDDAVHAERRCGLTLRGLCDADVADWLHGVLLEADGPAFVYWLTLNAHVPLDEPAAGPGAVDCAASPALARHAELCRLVRHHGIVFEALAEMALDPRLDPTAFVVVGDHAPAFLGRTVRSFFRETAVPYITLWPRAGDDADAGADEALTATGAPP